MHTDNLHKDTNKPTTQQAVTYKSLMRLYDDTEALLKLAYSYGDQVDMYLKDLQKLVDTIEKNTEAMLDTFYKNVEQRRAISGTDKVKVEKASKEINVAIQKFLSKLNA